jgi:transcriptional regulator with XRE-family HTH domain
MITPAQSRGARGILDWTQHRLASEASVSLSTVKDFEGGRRTPIENNLAAMRRAFESAGVEFLNEESSGVRLRPGIAKRPAPGKPASRKPAKPGAMPPGRPAKGSKI